jgi:hypothetical protein
MVPISDAKRTPARSCPCVGETAERLKEIDMEAENKTCIADRRAIYRAGQGKGRLPIAGDGSDVVEMEELDLGVNLFNTAASGIGGDEDEDVVVNDISGQSAEADGRWPRRQHVEISILTTISFLLRACAFTALICSFTFVIASP